MNVLHNDERIFWKTMTPHRCAALYREYFRPARAAEKPSEPKQQSLSAYLMGGG